MRLEHASFWQGEIPILDLVEGNLAVVTCLATIEEHHRSRPDMYGSCMNFPGWRMIGPTRRESPKTL